jgi:AraC-like DNA-binding protein
MAKINVQVGEGDGDAAEQWADLVCAHLVQAECQNIPDPSHFSAQIELNAIAGLRVACVSGDAQTVSRTGKHLTAASDEHFLLNIQKQGTGLVRQDGREVMLKPSEMALYCSSRPYQLEFTAPFEQNVLILSAEALRQQLPDIDKLVASNMNTLALNTRLLSIHVDGLLTLNEPESTGDMIEQATLSMLVDAVRSGHPPTERSNGLSSYHMQRINYLLAENVGNPDFGVKQLAALLGLSEGYLNRFFLNKTGESPGKWILERRLLLCRLALATPSCFSMSITEVAFSWGFGSYAHFSRTFHRRFGLSPSDWRQRHLGQRAVATSAVSPPPARQSKQLASSPDHHFSI